MSQRLIDAENSVIDKLLLAISEEAKRHGDGMSLPLDDTTLYEFYRIVRIWVNEFENAG